MNLKIFTICSITLMLLIITPAIYPFLKYKHTRWYNNRIDYSCNVDEDCAIKLSGCGTCGYSSSCMNKDSITPNCEMAPEEMLGECFSYNPRSCRCVKNTCASMTRNYKTDIQFDGIKAIIKPEDKKCELNKDCVLFQPDCEDCEFDTINSKMLSKYLESKNQNCSIFKPEKMCEVAFMGEIKCINNKCAIE